MENEPAESIVTLKLSKQAKTIPYPSQERDSFKSSNHGFKVLKGKPQDISLIPEAKDNQHIIKALEIINDERIAFFSVGCEKAFNYKPEYGHWARGYIEFSYNAVELVKDARNYFGLFYQFNDAIWEHQFNLPVRFDWEFDRAIFTDADNQTGFSCAVWITTNDLQSAEDAKYVWQVSLDFLAGFLGQFGQQNDSTKIY